MVKHTIWYCDQQGLVLKSIVVEGGTNEECLAVARIVWDALNAQGYHLGNTRP